jgi:purine-binding chemotaxis protein CheW
MATLNMNAAAGKYLTFHVAAEIYGIEVLHVREIVGISVITAVPHTPKFIKGVMNLRGKIIPLIDLRLKFGMEPRDYTRETCVVVVEAPGSRERILIGAIVDGVRDVINVNATEIEEVPSFGVQVNTAFLKGLANIKSALILLLDIENVLSHDELTAIEAVPEGLDSDDENTQAPEEIKDAE